MFDCTGAKNAEFSFLNLQSWRNVQDIHVVVHPSAAKNSTS